MGYPYILDSANPQALTLRWRSGATAIGENTISLT
jgi:hypothetical protein